MTRAIMRAYETFEDVRGVVDRLGQVGVPLDAISLIGHQEAGGKSATEGAGVGGLVGAAAGLLTGLGVLAIPGIGPVAAAGWLTGTTATGAAAGALAGGFVRALTDSGLAADDAHYYAETVRRGASIISVRVEEPLATTVEAIMEAANPIDAVSRRAAYQREGWTRFDEQAGPYSPPAWSDLS